MGPIASLLTVAAAVGAVKGVAALHEEGKRIEAEKAERKAKRREARRRRLAYAETNPSPLWRVKGDA